MSAIKTPREPTSSPLPNFKIVLVGIAATGKTSLLSKFISGGIEDFPCTIAMDFKV